MDFIDFLTFIIKSLFISQTRSSRYTINQGKALPTNQPTMQTTNQPTNRPDDLFVDRFGMSDAGLFKGLECVRLFSQA